MPRMRGPDNGEHGHFPIFTRIIAVFRVLLFLSAITTMLSVVGVNAEPTPAQNTCASVSDCTGDDSSPEFQNVPTSSTIGNARGVALTVETANRNVIAADYAVRGAVLIRANEIEKDLSMGNASYPFDRVIKCNIGNPQSLGQKPISFLRQVLSLVMNPDLLEEDVVTKIYPEDVVQRAKRYLAATRSAGAYSASNGVELVREEVAEFIQARDEASVTVDSEDVFITGGASDAVEKVMRLLIRSSDDAILTPIPQYPLYSALTTLMDGHFAPYYMGEETGWEMDMYELNRAYEEAVALGKTVRGMVVINPGNPTGSILSKSNMREILEFCQERRIVLLADEVYQTNVYKDTPFFSFRKIADEIGFLQQDQNSGLQLASFHSISKGMVGECGLRGGYVELYGFSKAVKEQLYKVASIKLCSNVPGQLAVGLMVNPPKPGSPSYPRYKEETLATFESLKRRANLLESSLNALPGIRCNAIQGAMYAFPQITLPQGFIDDAESNALSPDMAYSLQVLEKTGIVIVPGSGFRQRNGTWHFRTTFLPPETDFKTVIERFSEFHHAFMSQWK